MIILSSPPRHNLGLQATLSLSFLQTRHLITLDTKKMPPLPPCTLSLPSLLLCHDHHMPPLIVTLVLQVLHISPPKDAETPIESPIPISLSSSVGSSSPVRSTTPPPDYPFDKSILDNSLWIIPQPLGSEPVPKKPNDLDAYVLPREHQQLQAAIRQLVVDSVVAALENLRGNVTASKPQTLEEAGTDIQKESQKRPNQARDGKDKVKSKPKTISHSKAHSDPVYKDLQVVSEPPKGLYTRLNKDQNLLIHQNQVVMSANDNFSLHDDEELSLFMICIFGWNPVPASNKGRRQRKARTLLLMAVPKDHLRRFHGMDDAKEIWAAIKTRFGGNGNSKKMQKKPVRTEKEVLMTIDEGQINWVEQTADEELNHALMAFTVNNEVSMCSKLCLDSYNALQAKYNELQSELGTQEAALVAHKLAVKKLESQLKASHKQQSSLNEKLNFQANQIFEKDEKLKKYRRIGMKAVKDKDYYKKLLILGASSKKSLEAKKEEAGNNQIPLYSRFKQVEYKGVPHPLSGDYTPREQEDIDDSLYEYGKHGPQPKSPSPTVSNAIPCFSICPSHDM
ncbi:hypothetical protein Tco_0459523 [Tanacetum coccineum]